MNLYIVSILTGLFIVILLFLTHRRIKKISSYDKEDVLEKNPFRSMANVYYPSLEDSIDKEIYLNENVEPIFLEKGRFKIKFFPSKTFFIFNRLKTPTVLCRESQGFISNKNLVTGSYLYDTVGVSQRNLVVSKPFSEKTKPERVVDQRNSLSRNLLAPFSKKAKRVVGGLK